MEFMGIKLEKRLMLKRKVEKNATSVDRENNHKGRGLGRTRL